MWPADEQAEESRAWELHGSESWDKVWLSEEILGVELL